MVIYAIVQAYKYSSTSKYNLENYLTRNNIHICLENKLNLHLFICFNKYLHF